MTTYYRARANATHYRIESSDVLSEPGADWERITESDYLSRPLGAYTEFDEAGSFDAIEQWAQKVLNP